MGGVAQTDLLRCDEFPFLHHPHPSRRDRCNAQLVRAHDRQKGPPRISAVLPMPYRPILAPLARLLQMPGFEELLESWRPRFRARRDTDPLIDIHDGRLWREFQRFGGEPLLEAEGTIAFCMWGDWIQPFVKTMYSLGAIMLAIANLPRSVRFDRANIILVQAFPGGSEKVDCQQLLRLLVEDLLALWNGITIATAKYPGGRKIRCFLLQCLADAPGVRKLFAFVGINAICGCIKCKVQFPSTSSCSEDKKATRNWNTDFKKPSPARTRADMESASAKYSASKSPSERKKVAKAEGSKFCVFLQLVYLNVVRACPIEAMHNLYEGTGKVRFLRFFVFLIDGCDAVSLGGLEREVDKSTAQGVAEKNRRNPSPERCWQFWAEVRARNRKPQSGRAQAVLLVCRAGRTGWRVSFEVRAQTAGDLCSRLPGDRPSDHHTRTGRGRPRSPGELCQTICQAVRA